MTVRYLDSSLLRNVLRHVDVHNRLIEEQEMWKLREKDEIPTKSNSRGKDKRYGRMRSDSVDNRTILKQKEKSGKWNHSGFMELYPDEFLDKQSMDEMSSDDDDDKKTKKDKQKRKKTAKSMKKSKKKRSTDEMSSDGEINRRKEEKLKKRILKRIRNSNAGKSHPHTSKTEMSVPKMLLGKEASNSRLGDNHIKTDDKRKDDCQWNGLEDTIFDLKQPPKKRKKEELRSKKSERSAKRHRKHKRRREEQPKHDTNR